MAQAEIQFLDITIDKEKLNAGAEEVLKHVRPQWSKDAVKIEVGLSCFMFCTQVCHIS